MLSVTFLLAHDEAVLTANYYCQFAPCNDRMTTKQQQSRLNILVLILVARQKYSCRLFPNIQIQQQRLSLVFTSNYIGCAVICQQNPDSTSSILSYVYGIPVFLKLLFNDVVISVTDKLLWCTDGITLEGKPQHSDRCLSQCHFVQHKFSVD